MMKTYGQTACKLVRDARALYPQVVVNKRDWFSRKWLQKWIYIHYIIYIRQCVFPSMLGDILWFLDRNKQTKYDMLITRL